MTLTSPLYTRETNRKLGLVELAETYLLDYRPPGVRVTTKERLRLCELIGAGWSPSDAAEHVQAAAACA